MELHQVRYFLAACETKSFTRAAARCRVSQPALTAAISKLEEELGGRLFERDHGGARLTALGGTLRPRFQRLAKECDEVATTAKRELRHHQETLRLGVLGSIGSGRLAPLLAELRRRAPAPWDLWMDVTVEGADGLIEKLRDGDLETAMTSLDGPAPAWVVALELYDEPYVALLPPGHRLLATSEIRLHDLLDEPYVDRAACEMGAKVMASLAEEGLSLRPVFRAERDEWVPSLVESGLGYALLPACSVPAHARNARPLATPTLARKVSLLRNAERPLSPSGQLFWELARATRER